MTEVNLGGADLTRANLQGVDLTRADLEATVLVEARLARANFRCQTVKGADFTRTDLTDIILHPNEEERLGRLLVQMFRATGIEEARFSGPDRVSEYGETALRYAEGVGMENEVISSLRETIRRMTAG